MISERTRELMEDAANVRELDLIQVKGKSKPTRVLNCFRALIRRLIIRALMRA